MGEGRRGNALRGRGALAYWVRPNPRLDWPGGDPAELNPETLAMDNTQQQGGATATDHTGQQVVQGTPHQPLPNERAKPPSATIDMNPGEPAVTTVPSGAGAPATNYHQAGDRR